MEGKNFYHISTDGTSAKIIFRNDMDYIKGMNYIPVCMSGLNGIPMEFSRPLFSANCPATSRNKAIIVIEYKRTTELISPRFQD